MTEKKLLLFICFIVLLKYFVSASDQYEYEDYDEEYDNHIGCNELLSKIDKNCTQNGDLKVNNNSFNGVNKSKEFDNQKPILLDVKNKTQNSGESLKDYDSDYDENQEDNFQFDSMIDSISSIFYNQSENMNQSQRVDTSSATYDKLSTVYKKLHENIEPVKSMLMQRLFELITSLELSNECLASFVRINDGLGRGQLWAFKFFDSMGSLPSGLTEGVLSSFGEYEQCLDIESPEAEHKFYGKYCLAKPVIQLPSFEAMQNYKPIRIFNEDVNKLIESELKTNVNTLKLLLSYNIYTTKLSPFRLGICIPSTCSASDIQNAINKVLYPIAKIPIEVGPQCNVKHDKLKLNTYQIILLIVLMIQLSLVTMSTIIAICLNRNLLRSNRIENKFDFKQYVGALSLIENTKTLFSPTNKRLIIVDTLMLLYIIWVITSQYYLAPITISFIGYKKVFGSFIIKLISDKKYFWLRTFYPKDSIFLLSGIIIAFDFFGNKHKVTKLLSYPKFILEKWFRFSLKIVGPMIALNLMSVSGYGPIWHLGQQFFVDSCQKNYWKNLIFANNYVEDLGEICNSPSFIISVIFHLQIISPLLMMPLKLAPKVGFTFNILVIIFSCFLSTVPRYYSGLKLIPYEVSKMYSITEMKRSFVRFTITTDQNLSVFAIGILAGYLLRNRSAYQKMLNRKFNRIFLSIFCPLLSAIAIVWGENFKDINESPNQLNLMLWFAFGKVLWSLGNVWIIYALYTGGKGILYRFLSSKTFRPLTRLSFGICLVNNMVINFRIFTRRENFELNHLNQIQFLVIDLMLMLVISYIIYVLFECPFTKLIEVFKNTDRIGDNNNNDNQFNQLDIVCHKTKGDVELKFTFPSN